MSSILLVQGFCPLKQGYKKYKQLASSLEQFGPVSCVEYNDADYIEDIATRLEHLISENEFSYIICSGLAGSLILHMMRQNCKFGSATIVFCQDTPLHEMSKFSISVPFKFYLPLLQFFGITSFTVRHLTNISFAMTSDVPSVLYKYRNPMVVLYSVVGEPLDNELIRSFLKWHNGQSRIFKATRNPAKSLAKLF